MNTAYSTFTGRSKSGRGKLPYGMTEKQMLRLSNARADQTSDELHAQNMLKFTEIYVQHARDLAKSGFKDEARNWFRFFNNSNIITVLGVLKAPGNLAQLREDLNFLGLECHPLEPSNFTTDIESIRNCLAEILTHVKKTPRKSKAVPCSSASGLLRRNPRGYADDNKISRDSGEKQTNKQTTKGKLKW
jgi:hypothetical protein